MKLAEPLADYLRSLPASDDSSAYVFSRLAALGENETAPLSRTFAEEILIPAGLMVRRKKNHAANGTGRSGKRNVNEVTFHSLRHSMVTMLKATGASQAMAQMIVGHDSTAVSKRYTHLSAEDTAEAIGTLPDVTKEEGPKPTS
jgi:integrase